MGTFEYQRPEQQQTSSWVSGLSKDARMAMVAVAAGPSAAKQLLSGPNGDPVSGSLDGLAGEWAANSLNNIGTGFHTWYTKYNDRMGVSAPSSLDELAPLHPNLSTTVTRLHEAQQQLSACAEVTPEGDNIGEAMKLVLIPWQEMRDNLSDFDGWLKKLRDAQGVGRSDDFFNSDLLAAIKGDKPLYRDPDNPSSLLRPSEYLDRKISENGPWGLMLAQASNEAGIESKRGKSPDDMTDEGTSRFAVQGCYVDNMGVFEWIALTLQEKPDQLSNRDYSWLLANRITSGGDSFVPDGDWLDGRVRSDLRWADNQFGDVRVRLAVM